MDGLEHEIRSLCGNDRELANKIVKTVKRHFKSAIEGKQVLGGRGSRGSGVAVVEDTSADGNPQARIHRPDSKQL